MGYKNGVHHDLIITQSLTSELKPRYTRGNTDGALRRIWAVIYEMSQVSSDSHGCRMGFILLRSEHYRDFFSCIGIGTGAWSLERFSINYIGYAKSHGDKQIRLD